MLHPLYIYGFLRTLAFIIVFYYLFKLIGRLLRPYLIKYINKKAQERFGGQFQNQRRQTYQGSRPNEGETVIDKMPNSQKKSNNNVGEYVDFEEVD